MDEKKYELTNETIEIKYVDLSGEEHVFTLSRIRALRDFGSVKKGELGGYVEHKSNLSDAGDCWVGDDAMVFYGAIVEGDAKVYGNAKVFSGAHVSDCAEIYGSAEVANGTVDRNAKIFGEAKVYFAHISLNTTICGDAFLYGDVIHYE